jgi:hypothetical protein
MSETFNVGPDISPKLTEIKKGVNIQGATGKSRHFFLSPSNVHCKFIYDDIDPKFSAHIRTHILYTYL